VQSQQRGANRSERARGTYAAGQKSGGYRWRLSSPPVLKRRRSHTAG
jgi:hypothetical protein